LADCIDQLKKIDFKTAHIFNITGGEPSCYPYLADFIKFIKIKNKNNYVKLFTNSLTFAYPDYAKTLNEAGVDSLLVPFYSLNKNTTISLTKNKNTPKLLRNALDNINNQGIKTTISIVLVRHNLRELNKIFGHLQEQFTVINGYLFSWIFDPKNYQKKQEYHINYKMLDDIFDKTLNQIKQQQKDIFTCGIPFCYLKGYETSYIPIQWDKSRSYQQDEKCQQCQLKDFCPGIPAEYSYLYGTSEVKPITQIKKEVLQKIIEKYKKYHQTKHLYINNSRK
jgi:MoaA/NifB/PqqE/SkfB family radical SAM enzyme